MKNTTRTCWQGEKLDFHSRGSLTKHLGHRIKTMQSSSDFLPQELWCVRVWHVCIIISLRTYTCVFDLAVYVFVCGLCKEEESLFGTNLHPIQHSSYTAEGTQGISRYTAADARDATTSKQPSQLWRWSQTFIWRATQVNSDFKKYIKRGEKIKENPFLCKMWKEQYFEDALLNVWIESG